MMVKFWVLMWNDGMYDECVAPIGIFCTKDKASKVRDDIVKKKGIDPDEMEIKEMELNKAYWEGR